MKQLLIGVCTYKRPRMLADCLACLADLEAPTGVELRGLVVDNEAHPSRASAVRVAELVRAMPYPFAYKQALGGRNKARNAVLDYAAKAGVDYVALCDDDGCAPKTWLFVLYEAMKKYKADVITGPLALCAPTGTPDRLAARYKSWLHLQSVRQPKPVRMARASNVLFQAHLIQEKGLRFAEQLRHHGEDTDFFMRAWHKGARIYEIPDAPIKEHWTAERLRFKYFVQRHFWIGYYTTPITYGVQGTKALPSIGAQALWKLAKGLTQLLFGWRKGGDRTAHSLKGLLFCARAIGLIGGLFSRAHSSVRPYQHPRPKKQSQ